MIQSQEQVGQAKRASVALSVLHNDNATALLLALASLFLYFGTLAPDVVEADGGEFQFAAWNFSLVHPTGYPLYLLLGGIFQRLVAIGNPAFRLNLFTAITAACAVGVLYLVLRELGARNPAAVIGAAAFSVSRTFWYDANAAEVYDLNALFLAILMLVALRWNKHREAHYLVAFALALGLALTHHRSIILWIPSFALFFGFTARSLWAVTTTRRIVLMLVAFAAPLLLYLYIPLRISSTPYAHIALSPDRDISLFGTGLGWYVDYTLGRTFQFELGWDALSTTRLVSVPQLLLDQFGILGVLAGLAGVLLLILRRLWSALSLFVSGALITVVFASLYHIGDIGHYYIPLYLVWAVAIGLAANQLITLPRLGRRANALAAAATILLVVPLVWTNLPAADRSRENARAKWDQILNVPTPQSAIFISNDRDEMMPFWYMQYVETRRRDVAALFPLITPASEYADVARLTDAALASGRLVYYIKPMDGMRVKYKLDSSLPPLTRVLGPAADVPAQFVADVTLAGTIEAVGYSIERRPGSLIVTIHWVPKAKLNRDYIAFVHILDADGNKIAQGNDHILGESVYPTSLWQIGETLVDRQAVTLPQGIASGTYTLLAGMYAADNFESVGAPVILGTLDLP